MDLVQRYANDADNQSVNISTLARMLLKELKHAHLLQEHETTVFYYGAESYMQLRWRDAKSLQIGHKCNDGVVTMGLS